MLFLAEVDSRTGSSDHRRAVGKHGRCPKITQWTGDLLWPVPWHPYGPTGLRTFVSADFGRPRELRPHPAPPAGCSSIPAVLCPRAESPGSAHGIRERSLVPRVRRAVSDLPQCSGYQLRRQVSFAAATDSAERTYSGETAPPLALRLRCPLAR